MRVRVDFDINTSNYAEMKMLLSEMFDTPDSHVSKWVVQSPLSQEDADSSPIKQEAA